MSTLDELQGLEQSWAQKKNLIYSMGFGHIFLSRRVKAINKKHLQSANKRPYVPFLRQSEMYKLEYTFRRLVRVHCSSSLHSQFDQWFVLDEMVGKKER